MIRDGHLCDLTLDVAPQALAVAAMVARATIPPGTIPFDLATGYDLEVRTTALYAGRERGIALTVGVPSVPWRERLVIWFAEHRTSDDIFVEHWLREVDIDPPDRCDLTLAYDRPATGHPERRFFPYGHAGAAADHVLDLILRFHAAQKGRTRG